ncbi:hypothetical protein EIN_381350 [Entamoeba invadens IP1]|uniref:Competence protein ComEC n=1 Tax=Entamoeba invadens IP1 TaxID=370355 RepID=A0A0A1UAR1_ENTIV|nr:hypothetical protein EIN_381350 [Entamoeba invadens IP1]ELP92168.1 hypothetical protein EIN_381350 [Entamoeba invadens IP1]|eukprot:XP_004258939.1 hypothetical protein EIN_381350 [Entamoeba invadens IP1]
MVSLSHINFILLISLTSVISKDSLEIHVLDVGQADSQLIVFPSGYSILIDAGETSTGSMNCKKIAERIKSILNTTRVDVGVITHLHQDHVGVPFKSGFWYLLESSGINFGKIIDRDSGVVKSGVTDCSTEDDIEWHTVGSLSSTAINWICYATQQTLITKIQPNRQLATSCSNEINPPDKDTTIEIVVVNANGVLYKNVPLNGDHHTESSPPSENDYSIALRIQHGDFVYSTAGDLDGEYSTGYGYVYHDIETPYKDNVGQVDVYHANHHGSEHSNNEEWVKTLNPTVSLISCGANNQYGHPSLNAMNNMNTVSQNIFLTQDCNPTVTDQFVGKTVIVNDEIVVKYKNGDESFIVTDSKDSFESKFEVIKNKKQRQNSICSLL